MTSPRVIIQRKPVVPIGAIAVVHCTEAFRFHQDNPLTEAACLICQEPIGTRPATLVGAAALAGRACECGGVVSDVFLLHADHAPMDPKILQAALNRGLQCPEPHQ